MLAQSRECWSRFRAPSRCPSRSYCRRYPNATESSGDVLITKDMGHVILACTTRDKTYKTLRCDAFDALLTRVWTHFFKPPIIQPDL